MFPVNVESWIVRTPRLKIPPPAPVPPAPPSVSAKLSAPGSPLPPEPPAVWFSVTATPVSVIVPALVIPAPKASPPVE
jgi:hypothetical protein